MPEIEINPFHGGADNESENARDFINKLKRAFMSRDCTDEWKVQYFGLSLKDGGPAMEWYMDLEDGKKATWAALCLAFDERWPARRVATKTRAEKQEELSEARIREDELGSKVKVNGVELYSHVAWADKIEQLARMIPDNNNLLVKATRDSMAPSLRALVPSTNDTWATFCTAVRQVSVAELREKKQERAASERLKEDVKLLRATQVPQTPSKALAVTLERVRLGAPIPAPYFGAPKNAAPAQVQPAQQARVGGTDGEKWTIIQNLPPPPPKNEATRTAHGILVTQWQAANAGMTTATEDRPFPLTPGTAPLGSGECTGCGEIGHFESNCTVPERDRLPMLERRWRRKVNSIRKAVRNTNVTTAGVNLVLDDATAAHYTPQELETLNQFLDQQRDQGNGDGSSD
ncbi:hypothetical protein H0H92_002491 [Tricholoma furcatifolium]|nr:hypothetical protein H0H92_002491 [Tricholoma furcatifolium]